MAINKEFTVSLDGQILNIFSHIPGVTEIKCTISDLNIDCTYFSFDASIEDHGSNFIYQWISPFQDGLWLRIKDRFPGFIVRIYNKSCKILHYQKFIVNKNYVEVPKVYYSNPFEINGNSYADFFYTDFCDGIDFSGTVIDAGANTGFFTLLALEKGANRIYTIEPDPCPYYYVEKNFSSNPKVITINKAMSHNTDPITFYMSNEGSVGNSQYHVENSRSLAVETIDIPSLLMIEEKIDLLKLDIEGTEYAVLESLKDDHFNRISRFFIEYHNFSKDIFDRLVEKGYLVNYINNSSEDTKVGFIYAHR
jgi:hypothetical protein